MDAAELAERFDLGAGARLSAGPVARGRQGVVWRLDTADGRWAVKARFHPADPVAVHAATRFEEAAHAAGVPSPRVRRSLDGEVLADVGGTQVRVHEWVELRPPDALADPELIGAVVGTLHAVLLDGVDAVDPWHTEPVGTRRWDELVEELRAAEAPFAERLADLRDELVALESWIEPPQRLQTCHRDLWADNLLPTPEGGLCLVDWEDSGPADPGYELGCVLFEFARTDPGRVRALLAAYRDGGGAATVRRRGDFSMLIAQLGHITETAATDWLRPGPRSPDRADSQAWISEVFDEPHTREVLDTLLSWTGG